MKRPQDFKSAIPPDAVECIVPRTHPNALKRADYFVNGQKVGERYFNEDGTVYNERPFRNGVVHGVELTYGSSGNVTCAEPFVNGIPHGTTYQWAEDGRLISSYVMNHGTGIDLWRQDWGNGSVTLEEVHYMKDGQRHGFEWWLDSEDQNQVHRECHWAEGRRHGIEREWEDGGRLSRSYPRFFMDDRQVTQAQYIHAASRNPQLPPYRRQDDHPRRDFPPEVAWHRGHLHHP